jgi:hypothetical protein
MLNTLHDDFFLQTESLRYMDRMKHACARKTYLTDHPNMPLPQGFGVSTANTGFVTIVNAAHATAPMAESGDNATWHMVDFVFPQPVALLGRTSYNLVIRLKPSFGAVDIGLVASQSGTPFRNCPRVDSLTFDRNGGYAHYLCVCYRVAQSAPAASRTSDE